jgi:flagellar hook assembly protein FlgD
MPELTSVHPNPFNPQTTLAYTLWEDGHVQMMIYDVRGSLVRRLVDQDMPAGEHRVVWNGADQTGLPVASGIYFVRLSAGSQVDTRKIVLLK